MSSLLVLLAVYPSSADLVELIRSGDVNSVKEAIAAGQDVDKFSVGKPSLSPFMAAVLERDEAMVDLLLARGANVDAETDDGTTALKIAVMKNEVTIIKSILENRLEEGSVEIDGTDRSGNYLTIAAQMVLLPLLPPLMLLPLLPPLMLLPLLPRARLLAASPRLLALPLPPLPLPFPLPLPPLPLPLLLLPSASSNLICKGHSDIASLLIEAGALVDVYSGPPIDANPLLMAAAKGQVEVVRLLLAAGARLDLQNSRGVAPHMGPALDPTEHGRHKEVMSLLLEEAASLPPPGATEEMVLGKVECGGPTTRCEAIELLRSVREQQRRSRGWAEHPLVAWLKRKWYLPVLACVFLWQKFGGGRSLARRELDAADKEE